MLAFGKACLATARYDTEVPLVYFEATTDIASELDDRLSFFKDPEIAKDLISLSQKLIDEPSRKHEQVRRREMLATNVWLAGDYDLAAKTMDALGWKMGTFADYKLGVVGSNKEEMLLDIALQTRSAVEDYEIANAARERGAFDEATDGYNKVLKVVPGEVRPILASKLRVLNAEKALGSNEWVAIKPTEDLAEWTIKNGKWSVTPEGKLQTIGGGGIPLIVHRARVSKNYEVTAKFSIDPVDGPQPCFGIAVGYQPATGEQRETWLTCETYSRAGISQHAALHYKQWSFDTADVEHRTPIELKPENEIYVRREGDKVTFKLNGVTVAENVSIPKYKRRDVAPGELVGFVGCNLGAGNVAKLWDIWLRKL